MDLICQTDPRRDAVRRASGRNGLDYVEVGDDQRTLYVYFLGKLPNELAINKPGIERYLRLEGGDTITGLRIVDADPHPDANPERDDVLVLTLDKSGDFSPYTLRLIDVDDIDSRYDSTSFTFKIDCPTGIDCKNLCDCEPPPDDEPQINYLAKDYASFRQLILDRLALLMPEWTERHVPDLGITLVELLAYVGDQLSYYQDAVATEAYLGTARQRISVRRHARLVDYLLHEGCNARTWLHFRVSGLLDLPSDRIGFATGYNQSQTAIETVMSIEQLGKLPAHSYEYFEPLIADAPQTLHFRAAHNAISFYTWHARECCLMAGATRATLLDQWVLPAPPPHPAPPAPTLAPGSAPTPAPTPAPRNAARHRHSVHQGQALATASASAPTAKPLSPERALRIRAGDVLVFEEVRGAKTGEESDADRTRRWAVRVTRAELAEDPVYRVKVGESEEACDLPTPLVEIEWALKDALPFALCLSAVARAPDCEYLRDVSVARGNVILIDHGRTFAPDPLPPVPGHPGEDCCECEGQPREVATRTGRYRPMLSRGPVVYAEPLSAPPKSASQTLIQDPRAASPIVKLVDNDDSAWTPVRDLLGSYPDDRHFAVEVDNLGVAHLRFGNGELGREPSVGSSFNASYRYGGGKAGNVGAESICRLVLKNLQVGGVAVSIRNPLPAQGGVDPEPIEEARLVAPAAFRKQIQRAIVAEDYAELAQRNAKLHGATVRLAWTGSWYEADVSVDPLDVEHASDELLATISAELYRYRRMGHDLHVKAARYVPIELTLEVCALPGHDRGHVKAALQARFSGHGCSTGTAAFFDADQLSLGEPIYLSQIIAAAQAVPGVECVTVTQFRRRFSAGNHEIENGVLPLAPWEIAQLANDPNHPERGQLQINVRGGR